MFSQANSGVKRKLSEAVLLAHTHSGMIYTVRYKHVRQGMRRLIAGVGVDIVEIQRIARGIEQHGDAFLKRIYTPGEREYCTRKRMAYESLAARFAAKEAVYKSLRIDVAMRWKDIEVVVDSCGCPSVILHGVFYEHARKRNITDIFLSLSHGKEYAIAYAVAVTDRQDMSEVFW